MRAKITFGCCGVHAEGGIASGDAAARQNVSRNISRQSCGFFRSLAGRSLAQRGPLFAVPQASARTSTRNIMYMAKSDCEAIRAAAIEGRRAAANIHREHLWQHLRRQAAVERAARAEASGGGGSLCSPPQAAARNFAGHNCPQSQLRQTAASEEAARAEASGSGGLLFAATAGFDPHSHPQLASLQR